MPQSTASSFIAATYLGIARDAQTAVESEADGFDALIAEQGPNSNTKKSSQKVSPKISTHVESRHELNTPFIHF